jgi:uncharacterized protein YjbI with pentapeptide repeats
MRAAYALMTLGVCLLITALTMPLQAGEGAEGRQFASLAHSSSQTAIERLQAGEIIDCPGCDLRGADLSHTCAKEKNLAGAKFDDAIALYMCMSYANFSGASFQNTDLTGANLAHSNLSGADLTGAKLDIASLKGADLATVKGLTQDQLDTACADEDTKLPAGLNPEFCI